MFDLNPIDVLKQREVKTLPPHFSKIKIHEGTVFSNNMHDWIQTKLKGRFCIVRSPSIDQEGNLKSFFYVGFEDQKELTFFMLAYPNLRRI